MYTSNQTLKRDSSNMTPLDGALGALPSVSWFTALGHGEFSRAEWENQWAAVSVQGVTLRGGASESKPTNVHMSVGQTAHDALHGRVQSKRTGSEVRPEARVIKFPNIDREHVTATADDDTGSSGWQLPAGDSVGALRAETMLAPVVSLNAHHDSARSDVEQSPGANEGQSVLELASPTRGGPSRNDCVESNLDRRTDAFRRSSEVNAEEPVACAAGDVDAGLVGVKWSGLPVGFRRRRPPRNRRVVCGLIELEKQRNYDAMSVTIWGLKRCHQRFWNRGEFYMFGT